MLNFLKVLSRHGRLDFVRQATRLVKSMHATRRGMTDVEVRVAAPLDDAMSRRNTSPVTKVAWHRSRYSPSKLTPALLGGLVVRVGDRVYDGSVQSHLERTRAVMIQKATEQIESRREAF